MLSASVITIFTSAGPLVLDAELKNTTWTNALDGSAVSLSTTVSLEANNYLILKK